MVWYCSIWKCCWLIVVSVVWHVGLRRGWSLQRPDVRWLFALPKSFQILHVRVVPWAVASWHEPMWNGLIGFNLSQLRNSQQGTVEKTDHQSIQVWWNRKWNNHSTSGQVTVRRAKEKSGLERCRWSNRSSKLQRIENCARKNSRLSFHCVCGCWLQKMQFHGELLWNAIWVTCYSWGLDDLQDYCSISLKLPHCHIGLIDNCLQKAPLVTSYSGSITGSTNFDDFVRVMSQFRQWCQWSVDDQWISSFSPADLSQGHRCSGRRYFFSSTRWQVKCFLLSRSPRSYSSLRSLRQFRRLLKCLSKCR